MKYDETMGGMRTLVANEVATLSGSGASQRTPGVRARARAGCHGEWDGEGARGGRRCVDEYGSCAGIVPQTPTRQGDRERGRTSRKGLGSGTQGWKGKDEHVWEVRSRRSAQHDRPMAPTTTRARERRGHTTARRRAAVDAFKQRLAHGRPCRHRHRVLPGRERCRARCRVAGGEARGVEGEPRGA